MVGSVKIPLSDCARSESFGRFDVDELGAREDDREQTRSCGYSELGIFGDDRLAL